jgi:CubicO group peptidase (beta-lactamase class C family)
MNRNRVVPTEVDTIFRKHLIHGKVHDEGAILMGGISGHAGLFGNANDLTKLLYMYLRKGSYAGESFIHPDIVNQFTSYAFPDEKNRRGLAFDKKDFDASIHNAPKLSSTRSFGHSGFTGTYAWVDPDYDLVYVFLSNRVYPTRANQKINDLKIRQNIGDVVIKAIENKGRDQ